MRSLVVLVAALALACGGEAAPPTSVVSDVDRTPAASPTGWVGEVAFDGGDATLSALFAQVPPIPMRSAVSTHVSVLVDGLIEIPTEIRSRIAADSPLRLVMARIDGELRSAVAVRLDEPLPASDRRSGGPRGSDRVGDRAAVDDRIAVVADDPAMLELAFAHLAYSALAQPTTPGAIVGHVPASVVATTVRAALEHLVGLERDRGLWSVATARAAHDRAPDLADPDALIRVVADACDERLAYLPDLGDATITLAPSTSGIALTIEADVTPNSPLAAALAMHVPVSPELVAAMPTTAALVIATGTNGVGRTETLNALVDVLAMIAGDRMRETERESLLIASEAFSSGRGDEGALAIGATDAGLFALGLTRGGSAAPTSVPCGHAYPWTSGLIGAFARCAARQSADTCCHAAVASQTEGDVTSDTLGAAMDTVSEAARAALARHGSASSPDLARDLAALAPRTFAIAAFRPLRAVPVIATLSGPPRSGLPRGDGAIVLALTHESGRLGVSLRASTAAMADLDVLVGLFADETDSE